MAPPDGQRAARASRKTALQRWPLWCCLLVAFGLFGAAVSAQQPNPTPPDFQRDVAPIFRKHCHSCHGPDQQEGGLRLDIGKLALEGGDSGAAIVAGHSDRSPLWRRIAGQGDDERMPPEDEGRPLTAAEIATIKAWIDAGAPWPREAARPRIDHWAFQPILDPRLPRVTNGAWVRNGIDCFVLRRLESQRISPSPEATRSTLIRRAYLDVIGLPPTPVEWQHWMSSSDPDWYAQMVDTLLASPHYGERWGRHWLDLARYADSDGYEKDRARPYAWRWREWVIRALNEDLPFDEFSIEQLAGDLLPGATLEQQVATGFHRNTLINREGGTDPEEDRVKRTVDRTNTFGKVWLGLTVECAQCHSHKYDPLRQREYYQLYAFFNSIDEPDIAAPLPEGIGGDKVKAQVVREHHPPRETHLLVRGDFLQPADLVSRDVPAVLPPLQCRGDAPDRLDLAHWLFDEAHPLTARVTVNRIWAHYFGRGIVPTEADFGTQGSPPSHPELLDWLASRFRKGGWSLKQLHRLILLSATYRQSSRMRIDLADVDPENTLLARQRRLRVEAETVRDLALAASGLLERRIGGASVHPPQPAGIEKLGYANSIRWPTSKGADRYRRGLYTFFQRTVPYPMLMAFDMPDSNLSCTRRARSNTPIQALTVWNDPVFFECAQALGQHVVSAVAATDDQRQTQQQRARLLWTRCLQREPTVSELAVIDELERQQRAELQKAPAQAVSIVGDYRAKGVDPIENAVWVLVARAVMNVDEFITRP